MNNDQVSMQSTMLEEPEKRRVLMLGATGTIGRASVQALVRRGHTVVCFARPRAKLGGALGSNDGATRLAGATVRFGDVSDPKSLLQEGIRGERFDALVSCMNGAIMQYFRKAAQAARMRKKSR